jgi:ATP-binding cassette subfamily B protein
MGNAIGACSAMASLLDGSMRLKRFQGFLDWEPTLAATGQRRLPPGRIPALEFQGVDFTYPGSSRPSLQQVSFRIDPGEKLALVGLNGAGKSTLLKLMMRLYDPQGGRIMIDGVDAREYRIEDVRALFGVFFQDFCRYAFTLRDNVALSAWDAADGERRLARALGRSGAASLAERLPKGVETFMSRTFDDSGSDLSGGEWQKVAIARAFYRDAGMLILDEPASSLDPEAEHALFRMFAELSHGKSAVLVSHRLANVTMCDRIVVLEGGRVVETGTHDQLMATGGRYARLFELQARSYGHAKEVLETLGGGPLPGADMRRAAG